MHTTDELVVDCLYEHWEAGNIDALESCLAEDMSFAVLAPADAASFVGRGRGRETLTHRLRAFLGIYDVLDYEILSVMRKGRSIACRVRYHYRHKRSGLQIDGTMKHVWRLKDGKVVRFEVIHDAERMGAYFELTAEPYARV